MSTVVVKLREQLLAKERELKSREDVVMMWEDDLAAFECALGRVLLERNAKRT
jgi:hypothetical protein